MPRKLNWTLLYDKKFPNHNNIKSFCYSQLVSFIDKNNKTKLTYCNSNAGATFLS